LIKAESLPAGAELTQGLPNTPCDPVDVLGRDGSEAAKSSMFILDETRVQEAVGIFASKGQAAGAYGALNAKSRLACIRDVISQRRNLSAEISHSQGLGAGDRSEATLFNLRQPDTGERSSVEVVSIRSGRSVASLIFFNETAGSPGPFVDEVVDAAAGLLKQGNEGS